MDDEGRPVGEIRASDELKRRTTTEYRQCPYQGSRSSAGLPMNLSALKQVSRTWKDVVGTVTYLREIYLQQYGYDLFSLLELTRISAAGLLLPAYILFEKRNDPDKVRVPVFVAATHKMLAGVFSLCKNYLISQIAEGRQYNHVPAHPDTLFKFAEASYMLVGKTGKEVCAGSPGMIVEILDILSYGNPKAQTEHYIIKNYICNAGNFLDFAAAMGDLTFWMLVTTLRMRELLESFSIFLSRVKCRQSIDADWLTNTFEKLTKHQSVAFGADNFPFGDLPFDARELIIQGTIPLFKNIVADERYKFLFTPGLNFHEPELQNWLIQEIRKIPCLQGYEAQFCPIIIRCLCTEMQSVYMFKTLQEIIHRTLGLEPPLHPNGDFLNQLFGDMTSTLFADILRIDLELSGTKCVLMAANDRYSFQY